MTLTNAQALEHIAALLAMQPDWSADVVDMVNRFVCQTKLPDPGDVDTDEERAQFYLDLIRDNNLDVEVNQDIVCHERGCWVAVLDEDENFCQVHRLQQETWHGVTGISELTYDILEGLTEHAGWRDLERWYLTSRPNLVTLENLEGEGAALILYKAWVLDHDGVQL